VNRIINIAYVLAPVAAGAAAWWMPEIIARIMLCVTLVLLSCLAVGMWDIVCEPPAAELRYKTRCFVRASDRPGN